MGYCGFPLKTVIKGKCSTRTQIQTPGTDKNRKRNGTKTKLISSLQQDIISTTTEIITSKVQPCPTLGRRLLQKQNIIICELKTNKGALKSSNLKIGNSTAEQLACKKKTSAMWTDIQIRGGLSQESLNEEAPEPLLSNAYTVRTSSPVKERRANLKNGSV